MRTLLIKAAYKGDFSIPLTLLKDLPEKICLISTIQFSNLISKIKQDLEKTGKKIFIYKNGLILGCDSLAATELENKVQAFLYIGSGKFHIYGLALKLKHQKTIFIFNPLTNQYSQLDWNEIEKLKQREKTQKIKFLSAEKLGILVSTKPGQQNLKKALKIKENLEKQNKKSYLFLFDALASEQFENFPEIESWLNTSCPGLFYDYSVYNA